MDTVCQSRSNNCATTRPPASTLRPLQTPTSNLQTPPSSTIIFPMHLPCGLTRKIMIGFAIAWGLVSVYCIYILIEWTIAYNAR